jgi:hypothetical protein
MSYLAAIWGVNVFTFLIVLIYAAFVSLVFIGLIRLVSYLGTAGKERKLLRIELGKLSEEVHLLRQELKGTEDQKASAQSDST